MSYQSVNHYNELSISLEAALSIKKSVQRKIRFYVAGCWLPTSPGRASQAGLTTTLGPGLDAPGPGPVGMRQAQARSGCAGASPSPSASFLGSLGASWVRFGPSARRLGASWVHRVLDFLGKRWLHLGMPSKIRNFNRFLSDFASENRTQKLENH